MAPEITDLEREGFPAIRLSSPAGLAATYVPAAGMLCCSLTHKDEELLGQRDGVVAYAKDGATMGIPLLHPWANRLGGPGYQVGGVRIEVPAGAAGVHLDGATGLPIHAWEIVARESGRSGENRSASGCRATARSDVAVSFSA